MACSFDAGFTAGLATRSAAAATYDMYTAQQTETSAQVKGLWWWCARA